MTSNENLPPSDETEITLGDIIDFFKGAWRQILAGAIAGPLIAVALVIGFTPFRAEIALENLAAPSTLGGTSMNGMNGNQMPTNAMSFSEWRYLAEILPQIASEIQAQNAVPSNPQTFPPFLSSADWWNRNVTPLFGLSKSDLKSLSDQNEAVKAESNRIAGFRFTATARHKEQALSDAMAAVHFFKEAGTFIRLRSILETYASEYQLTGQTLRRELLDSEIKIQDLESRFKTIEGFLTQNPALKVEASKINVDITSGDTHFAPMESQLNAVRLEMSEVQEKERKIKRALSMNDLIGEFASKGKPLVDQEHTAKGIEVLSALQGIVSEMDQAIPATEIAKRSALERIRGDLLGIETKFSRQLPEISKTVAKQLPMRLALGGGLFAGAFLMILWSLVQSQYRAYQLRRESHA